MDAEGILIHTAVVLIASTESCYDEIGYHADLRSFYGR